MRFAHLAVMAVFASGLAAAQSCNRNCLESTLDSYLKAVTSHNPSAAPLFSGYRHTENAVVTKLGDGAWKSITSIGAPDRRYFDPETEQAAFFGVMNEDTEAVVVTVRIRVDKRRITEGEWYIARRVAPGIRGYDANGVPQAYAFNPAYLAQFPPEQRVVPSKERLSREELVSIANSYFDAITGHDGSIAKAHYGCSRQENGAAAGGNAKNRAGAPAPAPSDGVHTGDCVSNLGGFDLQNVQARRFPVLDTEAQIVLSYAVFIRKPGSTSHRNVFAEWFLIDDGKIRNVYSTMFYPDNNQPVPNWEPFDGNFPLPAEFAQTPGAAPAAPGGAGGRGGPGRGKGKQ